MASGILIGGATAAPEIQDMGYTSIRKRQGTFILKKVMIPANARHRAQQFSPVNLFSSSEYSSNNAWNLNNGSWNTNNKNNNNYVVLVRDSFYVY